MGTMQTKNNRKQDTHQGKSEDKGKSDRRKKGAQQGTGTVADSRAADAKKGVAGANKTNK